MGIKNLHMVKYVHTCYFICLFTVAFHHPFSYIRSVSQSCNNSREHSLEWIALNLNQILTSRQTSFSIMSLNNRKVGLNMLTLCACSLLLSITPLDIFSSIWKNTLRLIQRITAFIQSKL